MEQSAQPFRRTLVGAMAAIGLIAGACSNMPSWSDVKLPSASTLLPSRTNSYAEAAVNTKKPVTAADLVDGQGACAAATGAATGDDGLNVRGVGLDMTECQVVQALGAPQATDVATNERGERAVTMTFLETERAGLYRFVGGRLVSVERAPGAQPERPAKQPPKRQVKTPDPT